MPNSLLESFGIRYLHYMTSVENVLSILKFGIFAYSVVKAVGLHYVDISNPDVQMNRLKPIPQTGKRIHEYVPLYFATQTPMQYVITHATATRPLTIPQQDLVFVDIAADAFLGQPGVLFTDGNAASSASNLYSDLTNLSLLDWKLISGPGDYDSIGGLVYNSVWKRKRASEVLVPAAVPAASFSRLVVYDIQAAVNLHMRANEAGVQLRVLVEYSTAVTCRYYYSR